jgi:ABC-type glycerol-3-phosphate transport system substrate-binding protein
MEALKSKPAGVAPMELAYFRHPPFAGTEQTFVQNSGWSLVVPHSSEHQETAMDVVKFLTVNPPVVAEWNRLAGSISPLREHGTAAALASDPVKSAIQPLLEKGRWVGYIPPVPLTETRDSMYINTLAAMRGKIHTAGTEQPFSVGEAAQRIHQECNDSMARSRR